MGKKTDGLGEVIYDVTASVITSINELPNDEQGHLMDEVNGSSGLYWDHILVWAKEFQKAWLTGAEDENEGRDYLLEVDEFSAKKFDELLSVFRKGEAAIVVGVQVVPSYEKIEDGCVNVIPQFAGPTERTEQWSVYTRRRNGLAQWVADAIDEDDAMLFAKALANKHNVPIEPQPWKEKQ